MITNAGINTLKKLVESGNPKKMDYLTYSQKSKLIMLLPKLKLWVWLDERGLYSFEPILADKGYTDIDLLATMSIDAVMKLVKEISGYDGHDLLLQELDKLRKEVAMADDVNNDNYKYSDMSQSSEG